MDDIFVYLVDDMPPGVREMITPCADGYTVYISSALSYESRLAAYTHALTHIRNGDFDKTDVQEIEREAHG